MHVFPTSGSTWQISTRNAVIALPYKKPLPKHAHFRCRRATRSNSPSYKKRRRKQLRPYSLTRFRVHQLTTIEGPCGSTRQIAGSARSSGGFNCHFGSTIMSRFDAVHDRFGLSYARPLAEAHAFSRNSAPGRSRLLRKPLSGVM